MSKTWKFHIDMLSDMSAGLRGFADTVSVTVKSGDAGGEEGEFEEFMRDCLLEWYDGASVMTPYEHELTLRDEDMMELEMLWESCIGDLDPEDIHRIKVLEEALGVCSLNPYYFPRNSDFSLRT